MIRSLKIFLCLFLIVNTSLSSKIIEADSYAVIETAFNGEAGDTLGVFDIDNVLTYTSEPAFHKENWNDNRQFVKCFLKNLTHDQIWLFVNFSLIQSDSQLMDPNAWATIKRMQAKGIKFIALTGSMPGLLGDIYLQEWRYHQLKRLNVDFSNSFPETPSFCFNRLPCYLERYPAFYKGILMANGELKLNVGACNKGDVLVEFLKRIDWKPKKIIFIDDSLLNLEAVQDALVMYNPEIQFEGIHFTLKPPQHYISSDEFQNKWEYVYSLVRGFEKKTPCRIIYP